MMQSIDRRRFLRRAGAAGLVGLPALLGARLMLDARGEPPPQREPFAAAAAGASGDAVRAASIVVLQATGAESAFAPFLGEILRTEGVLGVVESDLAALDWAMLTTGQILVLAAGHLTADAAAQVRAHVERGGGLVAMRPPTLLDDVLGVTRASGMTADGYLRTSEHAAAAGVDRGPLQFHAPADHVRAIGAEVVAWLCDGRGTPSAYPAVTIHQHGQGVAAMWAFDLARSIVNTRQGNPDWSGQERDGLEGVRACDMFVGWVDLDRIHVAQADEQQRLLINLLDGIGQRLPAAAPLPRLWYFPGRADSMMIATGDSHTNPPGAIDRVLKRVEERGGTMSIYYTPPASDLARRGLQRARAWAATWPVIGARLANDSAVTAANADAWRARGHEFALHPYVEAGLAEGWREAWERFTGLGLGTFDSVRTHRVLWSGWVETARVQASYGVTMNVDYYHVGPAFQKPDGRWAYGYFTGSGLPMRFADDRGQLLDIYQQLTPLVDEQVLTMPWSSNPARLDVDSAIAVSRGILDNAVGGAFAAVCAQFHIDPVAVPGPWTADAVQWLEATLDYCVDNDVPIWSAERWASFTRARARAQAADLRFEESQGVLAFEMTVDQTPGGAAPFALMLPAMHRAAPLTLVRVDDRVASTHRRQVGGIDYGVVMVEGGRHRIVATYS